MKHPSAARQKCAALPCRSHAHGMSGLSALPAGGSYQNVVREARRAKRVATARALGDRRLRAFQHRLAEEAASFATASPIARGPAELARAVMRVMVSEECAALLEPESNGSLVIGQSLGELIGSGIALYADERGMPVASDIPPAAFVSQLESMAAALAAGREEHKRVLFRIQIALSSMMSGRR